MNLDALAPWACDPRQTRGRRIAEASAAPRTEHQRDRDRIVHSTAFRRLVYKTQVFLNHEGDLFRTRLTHSLEVAQIGRSIARRLRLNEDLVEAIALAHDLGHTPFGHAGQDALHACMRDHGGFEHNLQTLRVVDKLEARYAAFDGLNLCFETREGVLKHCSRRNALRLLQTEPDGPAWRFVHGGQASLEAQVADRADELAYCTHDIDDGVRAGLLTPAQLAGVPIAWRCRQAALAEHPGLAQRAGRRLMFETLRRLLSSLVSDLTETTARALADAAPPDAEGVRALPPLARLSERAQAECTELRAFLFDKLYRHPQVAQSTALARCVVADLFSAYLETPAEMPEDFAISEDRPRAVADYIAGMTDRYALREHQRLTGRRLFD
jgi:dGTPase